MTIWRDAHGRDHNIADMTVRYRENCMDLMLRNPRALVRFRMAQADSYITANYTNPSTGRDWEDGQPRAEMATEMAEREADALFELSLTDDNDELERFVRDDSVFIALRDTPGPAVSDNRFTDGSPIIPPLPLHQETIY